MTLRARALGIMALLSLVAVLAGCGEREQDAQGPDLASPDGVVWAFFMRLRAHDLEGMLALGTDAWRDQESASERSIPRAWSEPSRRLRAWQLRELDVRGDQAAVRVRVMFRDAEDREAQEKWTFRLARRDGRWWIVGLD